MRNLSWRVRSKNGMTTWSDNLAAKIGQESNLVQDQGGFFFHFFPFFFHFFPFFFPFFSPFFLVHKSACVDKVLYILRRPQNFAKSSPNFWLQYIIRSKVRWKFRKILGPSQNIWTLNGYKDLQWFTGVHSFFCNIKEKGLQESQGDPIVCMM